MKKLFFFIAICVAAITVNAAVYDFTTINSEADYTIANATKNADSNDSKIVYDIENGENLEMYLNAAPNVEFSIKGNSDGSKKEKIFVVNLGNGGASVEFGGKGGVITITGVNVGDEIAVTAAAKGSTVGLLTVQSGATGDDVNFPAKNKEAEDADSNGYVWVDAKYVATATTVVLKETTAGIRVTKVTVEEPKQEELTPATWYGTGEFVTTNEYAEWAGFVYGITRNANKTLTYEIEFTNTVVGLVVRLNDGDFRDPQNYGLKYTYTTEATYEDGETVTGFFNFAYTNGVALIDYTYTVGAENEKPAMPEQPVEPATARIFAYDLNVVKGEADYTFTYKANIAGNEANIIFYANGVETHRVAIDAPVEGENTAVVAIDEIPAGELTWAIELKANKVAEFGKIYEAETITGRGQAVINALPESDFFGYIYYTNRTGGPDGGLHVYNPDYTKNGGVYTLGETVAWGSHKLSIDAEGMLWLPDFSDTHSGVYVVDPADLTKADQFFQGERQSSGLFVNNGENLGGSTPVAYVYGEGANTKLYIINEDMPNNKNALMIYNIGQEDGTIIHTWSTAASQVFSTPNSAGGNFSIAVTEQAIWLCQHRANGSNNGGAYSLQAISHDDGTLLYISNDKDLIPGSQGGGIVIDKEGLIYIPDARGNILVLKPTYGEDAITVEKVGEYNCGYTTISSMSFDYAGNLVASVGNGSYSNNSDVLRMAVFAMPTDDNAVIVPAKKSLAIGTPDTPTALDNALNNAEVKKVMIDGQIYIVRDGVRYNLMGMQVR